MDRGTMTAFQYAMRLRDLKHGSEEEYDMFEVFAICRARNRRMHGAASSRLQLEPKSSAPSEVPPAPEPAEVEKPCQARDPDAKPAPSNDVPEEPCHHRACSHAQDSSLPGPSSADPKPNP